MTRFEVLGPSRATELAAMTFPAYRHLLNLQPSLRLLNEPGQPPVQPFAAAAFDETGSAAGLALAELPLTGDNPPELLSLFVAREARNRGLGTELLAYLEGQVGRRGFAELRTVYTVGKPAIGAFERVLTKCGWAEPTPRTLSVRLSVEQALSLPWLERYRVRSGCEIFPWTELTDDERRALRLSQEERGWIAKDLVPWRYDAHGFEPLTSLGLRCGRDVVAWVINHRSAGTTLRFTCSYIRKDLGRRGRILPLFSASIKRMRQAGFSACTFVAPMRHATMVAFVRRWVQPWANSVTQTRGSEKALRSAPAIGTLGKPEHEQTSADGDPAVGETVDTTLKGPASRL